MLLAIRALSRRRLERGSAGMTKCFLAEQRFVGGDFGPKVWL
jgi:hypothetical protein